MQPSAIDKGSVLQGQYVLHEAIGDARGAVHRATCLRTQKSVVVRFFRGSLPIADARLHEQLRTASRVRHPALAALEAFGVLDDGTHYLVSERASGEPLERWADKVGIPPLASAVELLHRVCVGLNAMHRNGLTHDAINPRNVFVTQDDSGSVPRLDGKLADVGVPAFMRAWPPRPTAAQFMAPEQLALALKPDGAAQAADPRMNVYSCGCLLYYLCTGGAPVQGRSLEELALAHVRGKLPPPSKINPQISPALDEVILNALAYDPAQRFGSVSELATALSRVRPARSASGVRPLSLPLESVEAQLPRDRRPTFDASFEERPTSESRAPNAITDRPPPPDPTVDVALPQDDPPQRPSVPRGSFSGPLPSAPPPPALPPRPRRRVSEPPAQVPITVLLDTPVAIERAATPAIVPEGEPTGSYLVAPHHMVTAEVQRVPVGLRWAAAAALVAAVTAGYWMLRTAPAATPSQATQVGAVSAEPEAESAPRAIAAQPARAPAQDMLRAVTAVRLPGEPALAAAGARAAEPVAPGPIARPVRARMVPPRPGFVRSASKPAPVESAAAVPPVEAQVEAAREHEPSAPEPPHAMPVPSIAPESEPQRAETQADPAPVTSPGGRSLALDSAKRDAASARAALAAERGASDSASDAPTARAPLAATPQIRELEVHGSLATSEVRRSIARTSPQLAACYARAARAAGRNGFGELQVAVEIDERGRARAPSARGAALPGLDRCVADVASRMAGHPPDTGTVKATWKVAFTP
jgi:serine/threonine-protein kinase